MFTESFFQIGSLILTNFSAKFFNVSNLQKPLSLFVYLDRMMAM